MATIKHEINDALTRSIIGAARSSSSALMLFGSFARGDDTEGSDVDVLELSARSSHSVKVGRISVYGYSNARLSVLAHSGSLFVLHLKREGRIIRDPDETLAACLDDYIPPHSYEPFRTSLRSVANLLDADATTYASRFQVYNELAVFVLRTALYLGQAEAGDPIFSLREIAVRLRRPDVSRALALKARSGPDFELFSHAKRVVMDLLSVDIRNRFGTVEALLTNEGLNNPALVSLGLRLLGHSALDSGYDLLTFTPLH